MNQQTLPKLHGLDHLRALAISFVFLFHYGILSGGQPEWLPNFASFGWTGVDLFFVLSGFLISSQLFHQIKQGEKPALKAFFIKRFFRIVPLFVVIIACYFFLPFFREKESLPPLWKFLTFTQNFGLNIKDYGTFSHAWSLCVEEHFYLFLPLLIILLLKLNLFQKGYWLLFTLMLLGIGIRLYSYTQLYLPHNESNVSWLYWYQSIYYPTYNRLDGLLLGVAVAGANQFWPTLWLKITKYSYALFALGLFILSYAYFLCSDQMTFEASVFGFPIIAIGYACLLISAVSPSSFWYKHKSIFTTYLANLSYAIYLSHKGVIHMTHQALERFNLNNNLLLIVSMLTCICFAFLLHITIEKPFMVLRRKLLNKQ